MSNKADLATERERQLTTARANQTTGLTNDRAENWAPEVVFSPFSALSVVKWRSRPVAKSAYCIESHTRFKNTYDKWFEYDSTKTIVYDFIAIAFIPKYSTVEA